MATATTRPTFIPTTAMSQRGDDVPGAVVEVECFDAEPEGEDRERCMRFAHGFLWSVTVDEG